MKLAVVAVVVMLLACSAVEAHWFRPPPPRRRFHPPSEFPRCQDFMDAIHEQMRRNERRGEGRPWQCQERGMEPEECCFEDLMRARMQINQQPSQECREQINNFLDGTPVSTTSSMASTTVG